MMSNNSQNQAAFSQDSDENNGEDGSAQPPTFAVETGNLNKEDDVKIDSEDEEEEDFEEDEEEEILNEADDKAGDSVGSSGNFAKMLESQNFNEEEEALVRELHKREKEAAKRGFSQKNEFDEDNVEGQHDLNDRATEAFFDDIDEEELEEEEFEEGA
jgi:hypothetical protein